MSFLTPSSSTSSLQYIDSERIGQGAISGESQRQRPHTTSIHILDNDSLLNIFYLYRLAILDKHDDDGVRFEWDRQWTSEKWWYKPAHICQRWRNLIFRSTSYLGLYLVCTFGTPVTDMLEHSPPLPLIIDYDKEDGFISAEDEEGILLSLEQRDRIRRIRLRLRAPILQKLIVAIDEEYPTLEYLILVSPGEMDAIFAFPETFQAPHLRHTILFGFALPTGCRLITTAVGLVTLCLGIIHPSTYLHPNTLLQWSSFMPQLEILEVFFSFPVSNRDVERQLMRTPIMAHVTLPNLRQFMFQGSTAYMEAVVCRITVPLLEKLAIRFFNQLTFTIPCLLQFMNTTENLRFSRADFLFSDEEVDICVYPHGAAETYAFCVSVDSWHLDWQVSSAAQIVNTLSQMLSTVEHLTFEHWVHSRSSEEHNVADRTQWRQLFRSFRNVKTLRIPAGLVGELSRCLRLDDGELPLELLPELQELSFPSRGDFDNAFTPFVDDRQNAGRPVTLTRF